MRVVPLYQVDAFAQQVFQGNPAAVMPLEAWLPDAVMQQVAAENNLSETAFFVPMADGARDFHLRWFTPVEEVSLCGHATLAAAFVIFEKLGFQGAAIRFHSLSGTLVVTRSGARMVLDFPVWDMQPSPLVASVEEALGVPVRDVVMSQDLLAVVESADIVRNLAPDMAALRALEGARGIIVTAVGDTDGVDFVSRAFFPKLGIDEDPVTGSAHCVLTPYWAQYLGKTVMQAQQVSHRGGALQCELLGNRVRISGEAHLFFEGTCYLPQ